MLYNRKQFRSLSRNRIPTVTSEKLPHKYRIKCFEISKGVFRPKIRKNTMTSSESRRFFHSVEAPITLWRHIGSFWSSENYSWAILGIVVAQSGAKRHIMEQQSLSLDTEPNPGVL